MLKDLPIHTRQSLYRCLNVATERWIESEPEITWAKYTSVAIYVTEELVTTGVNGGYGCLFDLPSYTLTDGSLCWEPRTGFRVYLRTHRSGIMTFINQFTCYVDRSDVEGVFEVRFASKPSTYRYKRDVATYLRQYVHLTNNDASIIERVLDLLKRGQ